MFRFLQGKKSCILGEGLLMPKWLFMRFKWMRIERERERSGKGISYLGGKTFE